MDTHIDDSVFDDEPTDEKLIEVIKAPTRVVRNHDMLEPDFRQAVDDRTEVAGRERVEVPRENQGTVIQRQTGDQILYLFNRSFDRSNQGRVYVHDR